MYNDYPFTKRFNINIVIVFATFYTPIMWGCIDCELKYELLLKYFLENTVFSFGVRGCPESVSVCVFAF